MLIEREAALKAVHEAIAEGKSWYSALSHLPSAEKTGKWIKEPNCMFRCSVCGEHYPSVIGYMRYRFCPHCGSRME